MQVGSESRVEQARETSSGATKEDYTYHFRGGYLGTSLSRSTSKYAGTFQLL